MKSIVIALVVVAVVVFGGAYLLSDPFHDKVDMKVAAKTEWTAENKVNDPITYITAKIKDCEEMEKNISTQAKVVKGKKASVSAKAVKLGDELTKVKSVGKRHKNAYLSSTESGEWPVDVNGVKYLKKELLRQLKTLADKATGLSDRISICEKARRGLLVKQNQLLDVEGKIKSQRLKLETTLESVKIDNEINGIEGLVANVDEILASLDAGDLADGDIPSVDELLEAEELDVSDEDLADVLEMF